ncbi:5-formyltetrahydrofolate cyclo-ligase [Paenibacillus dakarensis]|uniref:5-formyltetrahydrofolate cyclo-ligase n=1 Tax=Paenibacillus dakarensis TaxID=1527293 RepID=UPI0006D580D0|nr:5-formyltetrahydrofolate cyclo-ligase [Paenibacillus dakarensis]
MNISVSKSELRAHQVSLRDSIADPIRAEHSAKACRHAADLMVSTRAESMLAYVPFRSELDTWPLIRWGWRNGMDVLVPKSLKDNRVMELYYLQSPDELVKGTYGILEPDPVRAKKCPEDVVPGMIWVPGLAFDTMGGRLGYGGGYYDRLRDRMLHAGKVQEWKAPLWIGLGYGVQLIDHVPMECHDLRLDGLITENGYLQSGFSGR